jgi:Copper chaperone
MSKASLYFDLDDLSGKRDTAEIKRCLGKIPGVISVSVNRMDDRVAVDYDTTGTDREKIREQLTGLGFAVTGEHFENHVM